MANQSSIFGLRPIRNATSGYYAGAMIKVFIPAADVSNIAVGDPVALAGDGNPALVDKYPEQVEGSAPTVVKAGPGQAIFGVVDAFEPRAVVGYEQTMHRQGGVAMYANVVVDPMVEYEVQARTGVAFTAAMVGQTCDIVDGGVDLVYGRSGVEADLTTLGNSAANQLFILGVQDRPADNEVGDMVKLRVKINNSGFAAVGVAGA